MNKKTFLFLLIISVWCLSLASYCTAATVTAQSAWTYNGMQTTGGFTLEKQLPGTTAWVKIIDIQNIATRTYTFVFEAIPGRTLFRHRAFSGEDVGEWSDMAAYEYVEGGDIPKTTITLQYNLKP